MSDSFQKVADKYRNSPMAVLLFVGAALMLMIGLNNFAEDTYSSYLGLKSIEQSFNMNVQIWNLTYWAVSIAPQVASIIFFFMFLSTQERKWGWYAFMFQAMDFGSDVWYRSNGQLFSDPKTALMSATMTLLFFTFCSEFFLTIGFGLVLKLWGPAIREFKKALGDVNSAYAGKGDGRQQQQQFQSKQHQPKQHQPEQKKTFVPPVQTQSIGSKRLAEIQKTYHMAGTGNGNGSKPAQDYSSLLDELNGDDDE